MKILHICPDYYGTSLYKNMIDNLSNKGIENHIFITQNEDRDKKSKDSNNIYVTKHKYTILDRILFFKKQKKNLDEIIKVFDVNAFDLIHAHNLFSAGYIAYKLKEKFNTPYIVAIRNTDVNVFFKYMLHLRNIGVKILNNAKSNVYISPSYKNTVLNSYIQKKYYQEILNKSIVIPNGIDDMFLSNKYQRNIVLNQDDIKIIYVGEVSKNKNIITTIKSCDLLIKQGYNVEFAVIGQITYNKIKAIINKKKYLKYYPKSNKEFILKMLREYDFFVMPSKYETFGLVYAEAISQGLPIIYTKNQGFDGFFKQGEVGFSVSKYDYISIANYLLKIKEEYMLYSDRCIQKSDQFRWSLITNKYIEEYEK